MNEENLENFSNGQLINTILSLRETNLSLRDSNLFMRQCIEQLEYQVRLLKAWRFAAKSEKISPNQILLFNEVEAEIIKQSDDSQADKDSTTEVGSYKRNKPKRKPLPDILPREEVTYDIPEEEKIGKKKIGEEISEQLKWQPAKVSVIRHIRFKYATVDGTIVTARMPAQPIPKSIASPSLLAHIAVSKYADALPLYRQEKIFNRFDIDISRSSMAHWMIRVGELLKPIYNSLEDEVIAAKYVQCDETKIQVLKEPGKSAKSLSFMWVRVGFVDWGRIVLYHYSSTRSGETASKILTGFTGYLQTDGYSAYDSATLSQEVKRVGCFAHARRKFFDVVKGSKNPKQEISANEALEKIGRLYNIEKSLKEKSSSQDYFTERRKQRQEKSIPILDEIKKWADEKSQTIVPKSPTGLALQYLQNQWTKLRKYVEDGCLEIDDNIVENSIRPFAVGRKNWLFSDTTDGAEASSIIYSIIETAKANNIEPFGYLNLLLEKLPLCNTTDGITSLLPHRCKK
jgi:transposase